MPTTGEKVARGTEATLPVHALANPVVSAFGGFSSDMGFGAGKTQQQRGATFLQPIGNERVDPIIDRINQAANRGTFNEGQFNEAISGVQSIQDDFKSGKISQADYANALNSIVPTMLNYGNQIASSGSKAADSVRNSLNKLTEFNTDFSIYNQAQKILGRDITPQEYAQFRPAFEGPNGATAGPAYLAEIAKKEATDPTKLGGKAGQYSGQINDLTQQLLSRGATNEEVDYFGRLLASGQITPYEMQNFIRATPEYQTNQDTAFRKNLSNELAGYDEKAFNLAKDDILSGYQKMGGGNTLSSGLNYAITDALSKIANNRQGFLANLSANQYQGNKDAARADYAYGLNKLVSDQNYQRDLTNSNLANLTNRANQGVDYERQKNDYMNYLNSLPKQSNSPWDYLNAGMNVVNTGVNVARLFA